MNTRQRVLAAALAALTSVALLTTVGTSSASATNASCGALAGSFDPQHRPAYEHVIVLMEENWSYDLFASSTSAPFLSQLARNCGSETNFHAATHPSQPNYMAATSGVATGVEAKTGNNNVFAQVSTSGRTWKAYEESMPSVCTRTETTLYKAGHNPAFWYTDLAADCARNDVPLAPALSDAITADALPTYTWITPNKCHIFYWVKGCPTPQSARIRQGDLWLSTWLPKLTAMPSYQAGRTLILITFDEGNRGSATNGVDCTEQSYYVNHPDCQIPTVVVSPYLRPGTTDSTGLNLYSLLGTTEDILGVPRLGRAVGQPSMRATMPF